jgi:hypothetical protein
MSKFITGYGAGLAVGKRSSDVRFITVAYTSGALTTIPRLLGSSSVFSVISTGTNSNLTMATTTGVVSGSSAIAYGTMQNMLVTETLGDVVQYRPFTFWSPPYTGPIFIFKSFLGSGSGQSNTLGAVAAATWYSSIGSPECIIQFDAPTPYTEAAVQRRWQAGVLKSGSMLITQVVAKNMTRTLAMRTRINGAYGQINVPYAGAAINTGGALVLIDATHTDSVAAGDLVNNALDFSAGSGNANDFSVIPHFGFMFESTEQTDTWFSAISVAPTSFSTTPVRYVGLSSLNVQQTTPTAAYIPVAGVWDRLQCNIATAGGANRTATLDIDGAVGNSVIPMTSTGLLEDATHTDAITAGQKVSYAARASAAGLNSSIQGWGVRFKSAEPNVSVLTAAGNSPQGGNGISPGNFWSLYNHLRRNNVPGESRLSIPAAGVSSKLTVIVTANTMTTDIFLATVKGASGSFPIQNCNVPIAAGVTGVLTDATHTDSWVAGDNISNYSPMSQDSTTTFQSISLKWTAA